MLALRRGAATIGLLISTSFPAQAGLQVIGNGIGGDYSVADGTTLWSLVGGVSTPVAPGLNGKNASLHDYVIATGAGGAVSVFSLGELNPSFGGTGAAPYISVSGGKYSLVDPNAGAAGRDLSNLASLKVLAVPALPQGAGGVAPHVTLSGAVANPGVYDLSQLQALPAVTETISGDKYTGVPLYGFLSPTKPDITSQIVIFGATDGYEVVLSLAELAPAFGGNPNNLLPYADTGGKFPGAGIARDLLPNDLKQGRWVSNLGFANVSAVPETSTWAMMLIGFAGLGYAGRRRSKQAALGAA